MAPITEQLQTAAALEAAGLSRPAARLLAEKFEETAALAKTATQDALTNRFDKIDARFDKIDARFDTINARFDTLRAELRAEIHQSARSTTLFVVGAIGTATALLGAALAVATFLLHSAH